MKMERVNHCSIYLNGLDDRGTSVILTQHACQSKTQKSESFLIWGTGSAKLFDICRTLLIILAINTKWMSHKVYSVG